MPDSGLSYSSQSPSGSSNSNSKSINYTNLVFIMLFYILIAFVLAPMIGYFISQKNGLIIGYALGLVIILILWLVFGRTLI